MANKEKGEVGLQCGNVEYIIRFSTNALCELEDALVLSVVEIAAKFDNNNFGIRELRTVLWAGLRDNHNQLSKENVGEIIDIVGMEKSMETLTKSFLLAFPAEKNSKGGKKK